MNLSEAANRLRVLAEAYHGERLELDLDEDGVPGYIVTAKELDAVTFAAAVLGMFVEALEADALT